MNLIVFPLKHENPFPVKIKVGELKQIDGNNMILCTGIGSKGAENLGNVLSSCPEIKKVVEFGSAATISKGKTGSIYECILFLNFNGSVIATSGQTTKQPVCAVTGSDELYKGTGFEWSDQLDCPLIYTMETLIFRNITINFRKDFVSLRIVTDDGTGDIRSQVAEQINLSKKKIRNLLTGIKNKS